MSFRNTRVRAAAVMVGASMGLGCTDPPPAASYARRADVLVLRDFDNMRLTNDSDVALHDCRIVIDGGFLGRLAALPARGRATVARAAFGRELPRDEFYRRSGSIEMGCLDSDNAFVEIRLK